MGRKGASLLDALKETVCRANLELVAKGLVIQTWGNVSGVDAERRHMVIKPSGVPYAGMGPEHMVVVSLETGAVVEGELRPSSDTPTHRELYRAFEGIGGIVHTHSLAATAWAQAGREIPALGTTHADYFPGPVPCTRPLSDAEIEGDYEINTGRVIVERFAGVNPLHFPAVLVASHGPFAWGRDADAAVFHAHIVEALAELASRTLAINAHAPEPSRVLLDKHFQRKHGPGAYYGQK